MKKSVDALIFYNIKIHMLSYFHDWIRLNDLTLFKMQLLIQMQCTNDIFIKHHR